MKFRYNTELVTSQQNAKRNYKIEILDERPIDMFEFQMSLKKDPSLGQLFMETCKFTV